MCVYPRQAARSAASWPARGPGREPSAPCRPCHTCWQYEAALRVLSSKANSCAAWGQVALCNIFRLYRRSSVPHAIASSSGTQVLLQSSHLPDATCLQAPNCARPVQSAVEACRRRSCSDGTHLLTVAGDATARSSTSNIMVMGGVMVMISPDTRQSFLLSSSTRD